VSREIPQLYEEDYPLDYPCRIETLAFSFFCFFCFFFFDPLTHVYTSPWESHPLGEKQ
jgi:hypothetical protein